MHFQNITEYSQFIGGLSYIGIFIAVVTSGHPFPIPEAATLTLLGVGAATGLLSFWKVLPVAFLATLSIDAFMYYLALGGSKLSKSLEKTLSEKHIAKYINAEEKHLFGLVLFSHFVPGWRFANPVIVGLTQMPQKKFWSYNIVASLIHTPFYMALGYFLGSRILPVAAALHWVSKLFYLGIAVLALYLVYRYNRKNVAH